MRPIHAECVNCRYDGAECSHPGRDRPGFFEEEGTADCWTPAAQSRTSEEGLPRRPQRAPNARQRAQKGAETHGPEPVATSHPPGG